MKMLITQELFNTKSYKDKIPFECKVCGNSFNVIKKYVDFIKRNPSRRPIEYCSSKCWNSTRKLSKKYTCEQCKKEFTRKTCEIKKSKHLFCSCSCAGTYNSRHKTTGNRRSKLEQWIEEQLTLKYPNLNIDYNKTTAINGELDIYISSLKVAFELNGIFHYEPIYGSQKLNNIQNNDKRKFQACLERQIELCIIDTHNAKYLKKERDKQFLNIITNIIDSKLQS